jgi:hypothetical protein
VFRCVLGSEGCALVPRSSGTPVATWAWPTWVVSRRHVLEAAFTLLEFPSPSRRVFIGSHSPSPALVRRIVPSLVCASKPSCRSPAVPPHLFSRPLRHLQLPQPSNPADPIQSALTISACFGPCEAHLGLASSSHRPPPGLRRSLAPPRLGVRARHDKLCVLYKTVVVRRVS